MMMLKLPNERKRKLMTVALKRISCNILHFTVAGSPNAPYNIILSAYKLNSPFRIEHLVFALDGICYNIGFNELGICPSQLIHDPSRDGNIDPFDYPKIFDSLLAMSTWIGTSSGKTLLSGDGMDIYQLEIEADLQGNDI